MKNQPLNYMRYSGQPNYCLMRKKIFRAIHSGGLIAYPTEAVWGFGCSPDNEIALHRLLLLKKRSWHKGVILVTGSVTHIEKELRALPSHAEAECREKWPGHFTFLLPDVQQRFSYLVKGQFDTVAIRVSQHPFIQWYSQNIAPFLVSTSANLSRKSPARYYWQLVHRFKNDIDFVVPGRTLGATSPSRIIDPVSGECLRS